MENQDTAAFQKQILDAIEKLHVYLNDLALVEIAKEFYTKEERELLYAQLQALRDADRAAFKHLEEVRLQDNLSFEERVKKFGEVVANEQFAPHKKAVETKTATSQNLSEFSQKHKLIMRLTEAKTTLEKGKYD
jgi:uncharacterized protein with HEPN domain